MKTDQKKPTKKPRCANTPRTAEDWLREKTGRSSAWWYAFVQGRIHARFLKNPKDKNHDLMADMEWLNDVSRMAVSTMPTGDRYDGNMRAAAVTSYVLGMWYFRIHRAKAMDPNRPINGRQEAYRSWLLNVRAFMMIPVDESEDTTYFAGQKWDNPFSPEAKDGKFV